MQEIIYNGEHLWPKDIGHFLIVLGFVAALFAAFTYFKSTNNKGEKNAWKILGRIGFLTHGLSVFGIIGIIFYIMINKYYEYAYVSQHVGDELPMKYIFSAFWEGQEGSFLLWMFWHIVLGVIILIYGKKWESPVLSILSLVEAILISMLLGVHLEFGDTVVKFGSNPLLLFRDTMNIPLFQNADYVSLLSGSGLNPLLQNYWMTIHPPTLFLGFASTTIPFCYAVAGFWTGHYKEWTNPALKWALFSGGILGIGILMGGAWAYEALSFGGYWAWDPVENMSLVPWLVMVAAVHSLLIVRGTGNGIKTSYILLSLSFILILYSTFLTRSGVLGDTSVHAFTEMGLESQLLLLVGLFFLIPFVQYLVKRKSVPTSGKEDRFDSREFWMFIGVIVLLFSSVLITASTSLPIYNKIAEYFDPGFVGLVIKEPIPHYNKHQIWISIFIILLSSSAQYLRYNGRFTESLKKKLLKNLLISAVITIALCVLVQLWLGLNYFPYILLMIAGIYGIVTNLNYFVSFKKWEWKQGASVFSHLGFSIMIIGVLASGVNKRHISTNAFAFKDIIPQDRLLKNIQLLENKPIFMNNFWVTYQGDTLIGNERIYDIQFSKIDSNNNIIEEFVLHPSAVYSNDMQEIVSFNPSTKRYLHKDIFSHIPGLPRHLMKVEFAREMEDTLNYQVFDVDYNAPIIYDSLEIKLNELYFEPNHPDYVPKENDLAIGFDFTLNDLRKGKTFNIRPEIVLRGAIVYKFYHEVNDLNARFRINEDFFESYFTLENELSYDTITMRDGGTIDINGLTLSHKGFNRSPQNLAYLPEEGDIAVSSKLEISGLEGGEIVSLEPIYLIRKSAQTNIKAYDPEFGIHTKFTKIDPATGDLTFEIARDNRDNLSVPLEIAQNVPRSDLIVLEAIEFPGINLFWLGSTMMLIGMLIAMGIRMTIKPLSS